MSLYQKERVRSSPEDAVDRSDKATIDLAPRNQETACQRKLDRAMHEYLQ
jgi:hypothetical protein